MDKIEFLHQLKPKAVALATGVTGNRQDALEVVQDAIVKAMSVPAWPTQDAELSAWFYKIVRNGSIDVLRKNQKLDTYIETISTIEPLSNSPDVALEEQERQNQIFEALKALPLDYRDILVLKEVNGMSYTQLSEILDIPKGTVMSRLHRARLQFANIYQNNQTDNRSINAGDDADDN